MKTAKPIGNLLYTVESEDSTKKTQAELKVSDPAPEKALGVLTNGSAERSEDERSESTSS